CQMAIDRAHTRIEKTLDRPGGGRICCRIAAETYTLSGGSEPGNDLFTGYFRRSAARCQLRRNHRTRIAESACIENPASAVESGQDVIDYIYHPVSGCDDDFLFVWTGSLRGSQCIDRNFAGARHLCHP